MNEYAYNINSKIHKMGSKYVNTNKYMQKYDGIINKKDYKYPGRMRDFLAVYYKTIVLFKS